MFYILCNYFFLQFIQLFIYYFKTFTSRLCVHFTTEMDKKVRDKN